MSQARQFTEEEKLYWASQSASSGQMPTPAMQNFLNNFLQNARPEPESQVKQMPAPVDNVPTTAEGTLCSHYPECGCTYASSNCPFFVEPEPERIAPWVGVDLDGCLAEYDGWKGVLHIGAPVPKMVQRVKTMLVQGKQVKIFTARCWTDKNLKRQRESLAAIRAIELWCEQHIGQTLPVTCTKDPGMVALFDDRAVQVEPNTGDTLEDKIWRLQNKDTIAELNRTNLRQG